EARTPRRSSTFRLRDHAGLAATVYTVMVGALIVLPFTLSLTTFPYGHRMLALTVIFVSIVVVTGFSGYITLGQGAFAGFGGFMAARGAHSRGVPGILPVVIG